MSVKDLTHILRLRADGFTQTQIAQITGFDQATISRRLAALDTDTTEAARTLARNQALPATMVLTEQLEASDPRVAQGAARALCAAAGVGNTAQVNVGVQVILHGGDDPLQGAKVTASSTDNAGSHAQVVDMQGLS